MWFVLATVIGCAETWKGDWDGECMVDGDRIPVELDLSSDAFGILQGELTFEDRVDSYDADIEGSRSGDKLEIEFLLEMEHRAYIGLGEGEVDDDEMELSIVFTGAEYETEASCLLES